MLSCFFDPKQFQRLRMSLSRADHQSLIVVFLNSMHLNLATKTESTAALELGLSSILMGIYSAGRLADDRTGE